MNPELIPSRFRSLRVAAFFVALVAAVVLVSTAPSHAGHSSLMAGPTRPAASLFVADKGKLRILVNGQQVGKEEFEISPSGSNWVAKGTAEIQNPQGNSHVNGTLELMQDGTPIHYQWSTDAPKKASAVISFNGPKADIELHLEGARPYNQQFTFNSPLIIILDNNLYHQYAILGRIYDWDKKGAQTFSVLVPQENTPGSITVESLGKQPVGSAQFEELRVKTEDNEIDAFFDGPKLMRLVAPAANAEIVRE
ncbi:MAG: hypothetical protein WCD49_15075 [Candidatus Acidiferrales bacterium]